MPTPQQSLVEINHYQELALRTESAPTKELVERVMKIRKHLMDLLHDYRDVSIALENVKRFIFYGQKDRVPQMHIETQAPPPYPLNEETARWTRLLHALLGIFGEGHEMIDCLDLEMLTSPDPAAVTPKFDPVNIQEEFGDNGWYSALGLDAVDISMLQCYRANIAKLYKRYPEKFSETAAAERNLAVETSAMKEELTSHDRERTTGRTGAD